MSPAGNSATRPSLLGRLRLRPSDPQAWAEFVRHYGPRIRAWAQRWGLQNADADDVTQTVLVKLTVKLREFQYDPTRSFRGWLKTITHHAWRDHAGHQSRPDHGSGDSTIIGLLDRVEARRTLSECLEDAYDQELFQTAMERVQLRVEQRTWEAFRLLAFDSLPGAEVARRLGMKIATVYVARSKVQRMLRDEIVALEGRD